jgi:hypothetical protein
LHCGGSDVEVHWIATRGETVYERVYRSTGVAFRETKEGGVLLHLDSGQYHGVNNVGALIWSMLDGRTVEEIAESVSSQVEDAPQHVDDDVRAFVDDLLERGLATTEHS